MKILVVETPTCCNECRLVHAEIGFFGDIVASICVPLERTNLVYMDGTKIPSWCPLMDLPKKRLDTLSLVATGWNECLDTIESMNT